MKNRRVTFPTFEIVSNLTINLSHISGRPFISVYERDGLLIKIIKRDSGLNLYKFMTKLHLMHIDNYFNTISISDGINSPFNAKLKVDVTKFISFEMNEGVISNVVVNEESILSYIDRTLYLTSFS